ncbi:MAG: hypothetical protein V3V08_04685, partial [Nannocystaceae bacterium]
MTGVPRSARFAILTATFAGTYLLRGSPWQPVVLSVRVAVAAMLLHALWNGIRASRGGRQPDETARDLLERLVSRMLGTGRLARIVADELALVFYGTVGWVVRVHTRSDNRDRDVRLARITSIVMLGLVFAEGAALHFAFRSYPTVVAISIVLHIYFLIWVAADTVAMTREVTTVGIDHLRIRIGVRYRLTVALAEIVNVERTGRTSVSEDTVKACLFGDPNVLVHFASPVTVDMLYGRQKRGSIVALALVNADGFVAELEKTARRSPGGGLTTIVQATGAQNQGGGGG